MLLLPGFHPDPSLCRVGHDYWLVTSTFEYFPGLPVYHSRDLRHWTLAGHAIHRPEQIDYRGIACSQGLFAPTIRHHNGIFTVICTMVGGRGNFFVTAPHPCGPWSDPVWIDEGASEPWFDPSLFFDDDGKVYYTRRHEFHIVQAEIDLPSGRLLTPLRRIADPMCTDDIEGPHLYKINGQYYLLCAEGGTGWGHCVTLARSASPWGPFEPCPHNPILTRRHCPNQPLRYTGHGDLFQKSDGSWGMVFLGTRHVGFGGQPFHHLGRETFLADVTWTDGWPAVRPVDAPDAPPQPAAWYSRRLPDPAHARIDAADGTLRLFGAASTLDDREPEAFRCRRVDAYRFQFNARLSFDPQHDNEEAGLALVMADDCHVAWLLTRAGLLLRRRCLDMVTEERFPWCLPHAALAIRGDEFRFTVLAGETSDTLREFARADRRLFCTETATGWTGLMIGPYASGRGQTCRVPADFTAVEWKVL